MTFRQLHSFLNHVDSVLDFAATTRRYTPVYFPTQVMHARVASPQSSLHRSSAPHKKIRHTT